MGPGLKLLLVSILILGILIPLSTDPVFIHTASASHQMAKFRSYDELVSFIKAQPAVCDSSTAPRPVTRSPGTVTFTTTTATTLTAASGSQDHSTTNVQVQGVDELDTVKTDGQYIYTITNNTLVIVKAYPASEAGVVARISPNGTLTGVFVYQNKLVLIGGAASPGLYFVAKTAVVGTGLAYPYYYYSPSTSLWVYDTTNVASPVLSFYLQENGSYVGSRLIETSVYLITTQNAFILDEPVMLPTWIANGSSGMMQATHETVILPSRIVNGVRETTQPTEIYHSDVQDYGYSFTTVSRVDLSSNPSHHSESFLISSSGTLYVSTENIYLTSTIWSCQEETIIHRVNTGSGGISYEATGAVPGRVMNQFSMDEYQGVLRIATSTWAMVVRPVLMVPATGQSTSSTTAQTVVSPFNGLTTNVYTLDMGLKELGALEGLAPGELFHSARFMGDRGYLVTFKKTDPLFVIDLHNPTSLKVLGELYISGYSDYLQPYDENHLIGIGKNATDADGGTFAWYQGVKVSLFDVTDPTDPKEISSYEIGDRGTQSPALTDNHAVLFDHDRNLLVIPVEVAKLPDNNTSPWAWGTFVWQGAYVFTVSPTGGVVFRGGITHFQNGDMPPSYYYSDARFITRSLYIEDVLYTVSSAMVKMNSLTDLSEIGSVSL